MSISPARGYTSAVALLVAAVVFGFSSKAAAQVNGAIYTTTVDGQAVNANLYENREAVYLSGGPQNKNGAGLSPEGRYYFQVTDPSGAVLLSTDLIECREVVVENGRIVGVPTSGCKHELGVFNNSNGEQPVQLFPFHETTNQGGEYKVWLTPVASYSSDPNAPACSSNISFGFCAAESKTDNFKVRTPKAAYVSVCKFHDQNGNGQQDAHEPLIRHWPITATGVDGGTVNTQTEDSGCVSFAFSGFTEILTTRTITLTEGTQDLWTQTAPANGTYGTATTVAGGVITVVVLAGDKVDAPNFGNVRDGDVLKPLVITASASTSFNRAFTWEISKSVDQTRILTANGSATFTYTVNVTHDTGTDSRWQATGTIKVSNPNSTAITGVTVVSVADNGGTCAAVSGDDITVDAGEHVDVPYTCTYFGLPTAGIGRATATWSTETATAEAAIDFASATMTVTDGEAAITDTLAGSLGPVSYTATNPSTFTYSLTFSNQPAGKCTAHDNVASFKTNSNGTEGSASQRVEVCVGANLEVSATAAGDFAAAISKAVNKTRVQQASGSSTFGYTVQVTEHGWVISGNVTVSNPNDWQNIDGVTLTVAPTVTTASCTVNNGAAIPQVLFSSSVTVSYTCTFAAAPSANGGLTSASIAWDAAAAATSANSASTSAAFAFRPLTVTDTFNGVPSTLGTVTAMMGGATYSYSKTVANATAGTCLAYVNTAGITETGQSAGQTVYMCNTATGAHTIGFWQNKNGQAILTGGAQVSNGCVAATWLRQYAPFADLAATSTCRQLGTYAMNVIKAANASGSSMNAMLKAQMLATAFDVFYSTPLLGGNKTGAPVALGGVMIDLTNLAGGFGGATQLSVLDMLAFAASQSSPGGASWYGNVKTVQEFAKNAFDDINNARAYIAQ